MFLCPRGTKGCSDFCLFSGIAAGVSWSRTGYPLSLQTLFPLLLSPLQAKLSGAMSRRIRAAFGAVNFWAIVLYNILALNSLEFALLVTKRLLVTGEVLPAFPTQRPLF